jgi:protein-S-isoprenylcysteine O-methyltransferase Ste14
MPDELVIRRLAVAVSGVIYWGGVLIQARRIRRHIGRSPNLKPRTPKERALWVGWMLVVLVWIVQPILLRAQPASPGQAVSLRLWPANLEIWSLNFAFHSAFVAVGIVLITGGYLGTLWCYTAMGDAWRIGVNREEKNALVTAGPYRRMRHPIYSFQIVMLLGAALLLPTAGSIAILVFHLICVWIKAADEEGYLRTVHGLPYEQYVTRTGRLFPKLV